MELTRSIATGTTRRAPGARRRSLALRTALLTLALLAGATAAHAADGCFMDGVGDTSVFKKFKMPRAGDCTPLTGFTQNSIATLAGTACGTSDGFTVVLNFTYMITATQFGTAHFVLDRATGNGNGNACDGRVDGNAWGCSTFGVSKVACPKPSTFKF